MVQLATRGQEISIEQYSNQLADYAQTYTLNGRIIGELIWAGLPLTNAGVHLLDGSEISNSGIYTQFVSYISSCFENQNPQAKWLKTKGITLPTFTSNIQDDITISDARGNTTNLQAIFNGSSESVSIGPWSTYWISVDYAKNTFLSSYTIQADNQGDPEYPSDWKLQGSNDGTAWTDIHSKASIVFTLNQAKTFSVDQTVPYKQYRLLFSNGVVELKGNGELKKVSFSASEVEFGYENSMFATEEQWQDCVAKYGSCGKFVVSSSGVRLPKVSDIMQGTTDVTAVGDLIEAGLPNITGSFYDYHHDNFNSSGVFSEKIENDNHGILPKDNTANRHVEVNFNASRSNPIYGNSTTVQPQSIEALLYICVANSVKTQIQVDIDNIATDLNGKADVDLNNLSAVGRNTTAHLAMPSNRTTDLSFVHGVAYTAPADGYYTLWGYYSANGAPSLGLYSSTNTMYSYCNTSNTSEQGNIGCYLPAKKGDVVYAFNYGNVTQGFKFIYAEGAE